MKTMHDYILKITEQKLKYFNYSNRTIETYIHYIKRFLIETNKYHQHLVSSDFQNYLNNFKFTSQSQQNQIINSIKFFYEKVLQKKYDKIDFQRPQKEKHLPKVIDQEILKQKLELIQNIKHKAILSLAFSVGLRVSEVINLKIKDIDSTRMLIHINNAKGRKDRIVPLSEYILNLLREYYKQYKPNEYLFNGQFSNQYSSESCNQIVKKYLGNESHFHLLRHSGLTAMLENGTDLRIIQKIAGHQRSTTTEIYCHVSNNLLQKVQLAL